jgi:8-oxo-dGTP pyrophosphatase MutT (NUDIX family)
MWQTPGGKIEPAETQESAVIREFEEETGISLDIGQLHYLGQSPVMVWHEIVPEGRSRDYQVYTYWVHLRENEVPQLIELEKQGSWHLVPYADLDALTSQSVPGLPPWFPELREIGRQLSAQN